MTTKQLSPTWKVRLRRAPVLIRRIVGDSMLPSLKKDQLVLATSWRHVKVGSIVVARVDDREVIKRVIKVRPHEVWLEGDNLKASTDSRRYGWVDRSAIFGVVIFPLRKENV